MNTSRTRRWWVIGAVVAIAVVFVCCVAMAGALIVATRGGQRLPGYGSNGEQIYFTATSRRGTPIRTQMPGGRMMVRFSRMACVTCHNADGSGGTHRMMMTTFDAPDIRYKTLISPRVGEQGAPEPIFTEGTIRQAITDGVDPDGEPLQWPMPLWTMSASDLDDLVDYLKTLR
jgi:cytochrome c oxidase subunit 2